jgi:PAS domain S-box-containing protein
MPERPTSESHSPPERENTHLPARWQEAEESLRGIRAGEVDSLDVPGPEGEQADSLVAARESLAAASRSRLALLSVIEDQRLAEEELRHSRGVLAEAQRIAETGDWEWDTVRDRIVWSDELCRLFGVRPQEVVGGLEFFLDRVHPEDRARVLQVLSEARQDRQPFDVEHRILRSDGGVRIFRSRGHAEPQGPEAVSRLVAIGHDITERKQIEEALQLQTELYQSMLEVQSELGEGVLLFEGDTILYANRALPAICGLDEATPSSLRSLLELIDPGKTNSLRSDLEARMDQTRPPTRGETALTRPDGSQVHIAYTASVVAGKDRLRTLLLMRDETIRHQALQALKASRERLQQFSTELQRTREEESARISREIHDELGTHLTALKLDLAWVASRLQGTGPPDTGSLLEKARAMARLVDLTVEQVRRIASELRPGVLDDLGLSAALEWQASEFEARTGIHCSLQAHEQIEAIPAEYATTMFRIFQEALTNVARHAQAQSVVVNLTLQGDALRMRVEDDGRGITDQELHATKSLGLLGMRERSNLLGGAVSITRGNPRGTIIEVSLPLPQSAPRRNPS